MLLDNQKCRFVPTGSGCQLGLTTQDIDTIQTAIEGSVPTQLQRGAPMDIRVQLNEEALQRAQLEQLPLFVEGNRHPPQ